MRILSALVIGFSLVIGLWGLGWNMGNRFQVSVWDGMSCVIDSSTGTVYHVDGVLLVEREGMLDESRYEDEHDEMEGEMDRGDDEDGEFETERNEESKED